MKMVEILYYIIKLASIIIALLGSFWILHVWRSGEKAIRKAMALLILVPGLVALAFTSKEIAQFAFPYQGDLLDYELTKHPIMGKRSALALDAGAEMLLLEEKDGYLLTMVYSVSRKTFTFSAYEKIVGLPFYYSVFGVTEFYGEHPSITSSENEFDSVLRNNKITYKIRYSDGKPDIYGFTYEWKWKPTVWLELAILVFTLGLAADEIIARIREQDKKKEPSP